MQHLQNLDIEFVRSQFSALESGWAFLENAGGTLVSKQVVARVNDYMQRLHIQPNHYYGPSEEAGSLITKGQNVMADMIGATVEEVMIGPNTTANIFFLMQAIKNWFDPGDEIIVTNLDHEANNGSWRKLEEQGIVVKEWCFNCETGELEKEALEKELVAKKIEAKEFLDSQKLESLNQLEKLSKKKEKLEVSINSEKEIVIELNKKYPFIGKIVPNRIK